MTNSHKLPKSHNDVSPLIHIKLLKTRPGRYIIVQCWGKTHKKADLIYALSLWENNAAWTASCTIRSSQSKWASASRQFTLPEQRETQFIWCPTGGAVWTNYSTNKTGKSTLCWTCRVAWYLAGFTPQRGSHFGVAIVQSRRVDQWKVCGYKTRPHPIK